MAAEVTIASCKDILGAMRQLKERLVQAGKPRAEVSLMRFWYRGHGCYDWALTPSGLREPFPGTSGLLQTMLHEFRAEATIIHRTPPPHSDTRQWVFLMRHYEMPTFLIDWTRSPLAALFFAVESSHGTDDQDAALWVLRPGVWNKRMMPESVQGGRDRLYEAYSKELDDLFGVHFEMGCLRPSSGMAGQIAAIEPIYNSSRMIAQQSVFTIHGLASDPMEKRHEQFEEACLWKWRIHAKSKPDLSTAPQKLGAELLVKPAAYDRACW